MEYTTKLVYQSNYWYNDGLKKANIRDLSGAIASLRKSLQYNGSNVAARNLLGLVYYGRGDVVEALVEWILSKHFQSHDNIANYFIGKIQEVPGELETIDKAVKKFNLSLEYAKNHSEDLAVIHLKKAVEEHPTFVKAYQLLALLYIESHQISAARLAIRTAYKLDTTDDITLRYMHEITQIRKARNGKGKDRDKESAQGQTVSYQIGNESIIQPASAALKETSGIHTLINIAVGVLVGVAVMWFLIMPAVSSTKQKKLNEQTTEFSEKIAAQEAQISALKTELEEYRAKSEDSSQKEITADTTKSSYEAVMNVYDQFKSEETSDKVMLEQMLKITPKSLGKQGQKMYKTISDTLYPRMCRKLYATANEEMDSANYKEAITALSQIVQMNAVYENGNAMLLLAQAYEKSDDTDNARKQYQAILDNKELANTDAAKNAENALKKQK